MAAQVRQTCGICQATEPPNRRTRGTLHFQPVPWTFMDHVCVDIFAMPPIDFREELFDQMILCVDRLSSYVFGAPVGGRGLTGEVVANALFDHGWNHFGIPSRITVDKGTQFVNAFFRTLCSRFGIRIWYAQAYRLQGNGRAEVAGRQIITVLRKMQAEQKMN